MDFSIFSTKVCEKKRTHHWCSVGTGKSQPEGPPFQWETRLRRVSHWNGGPEGWDFPVPLYCTVTGCFGLESFRPWVVSAWVVSAWVDSALGRFGPIRWVVSAYFSQLSGLLPKVNSIHFRLVGECMGLAKALG